jgi:mono/diheme cytochrome c family protein
MRTAPLLLLLACNDDFVLGSGGSSEGDPERVDTILALTGDVDAGGAVFDESCAICHDPTGEADVIGPALKPWMESAEDAATIGVILEGQGSMPAQNLTDQETADVLAWMKETFAGVAATPDGAALFDEHCHVCHHRDGSAKVGPGMSTIVPNRTAEQLIATVTDGLPPAMPAFDTRMSADEIAALVGWMKETWPTP